MLKTVVLWLLLQPLTFFCPDGSQGAATFGCPAASGISVTSKTSASLTVAWYGTAGQYKVQCVRQSDGFVVSTVLTTDKAFCFEGLAPGSYTFYVAAVCGDETSGFIGIEDLIET
ncbi:MAG: fibronectin type III domain-containing protein [Saprospiraceae bacterium]|nr:fibronectin type III domain-containing protein [Saprospiraceae bacterium]